MECTLTLENTGTVGLKSLQTNHTECSGLPTSLAPAATASCTVRKTAGQADFEASDAALEGVGSYASLNLTVEIEAEPIAVDMPSPVVSIAATSPPLPTKPSLAVVSADVSASAGEIIKEGTFRTVACI